MLNMTNDELFRFRPVPMSAQERATCGGACEVCGRDELAKLVKLSDGKRVIMAGTGCAARITARKPSQIKRELAAAIDEANAAIDARNKRAEDAWHAGFAAWLSANVSGADYAARVMAYPGGYVAARSAYVVATGNARPMPEARIA